MSVTGLGGLFFKTPDAEALRAWYETHLGLGFSPGGGAWFAWREPDTGADALTVFGPFPDSTRYFEPSVESFMVNYRVRGLDTLLARLRAAGETVIDEELESEDGRFAWVMDPDGQKVELWEPALPGRPPTAHAGGVTGVGGIFFTSPDPAALKGWYADRLGVRPRDDGYVVFGGTDLGGAPTFTAWEVFPAGTEYFASGGEPAAHPFMVNFRVRDLDDVLARLEGAGVWVDPKRESYEFGKFGWFLDCDGARVELWEPPPPP